MTEQEWRGCTGPSAILDAFGEKISKRKLRLFAVACCRRVWDLIPEKGRKGVEVAEQFADGNRCQRTLFRVWKEAGAEARELRTGATGSASVAAACATATDKRWEPFRLSASGASGRAALAVRYRRNSKSAEAAERRAQADILRDIFHPWLSPLTSTLLVWNEGTVVKIAETIYEERAFDRLPILADAFEDAGCTDADILDHLRGPGPHVRGCWVLDLLLDRK